MPSLKKLWVEVVPDVLLEVLLEVLLGVLLDASLEFKSEVVVLDVLFSLDVDELFSASELFAVLLPQAAKEISKATDKISAKIFLIIKPFLSFFNYALLPF